MTQERENYCFLIGLNPFKETSYSAAKINEKIDAKAKKWTKDSNDNQSGFSRRFKASQLAQAVPDMHTVMKNPQLRAGEFIEGQKKLRAKASKLRKDAIILHDGRYLLLSGAEDELAKKLKWGDVDGKTLIQASGLNIVAKLPELISKNVKIAFGGMSDLGIDSPTELLNSLIDIPELEIRTNRLNDGCGCDQIRAAFQVVETRLNAIRAGLILNQDAYITAIRQMKLVLNDKDLEQLRSYGRCMKALEPAMETMDEDAGLPFTSNYIDSLLSIYARNKQVDYSMAVAILENYCFRKRYGANFSQKDSRLTLCPTCKAMIEEGASNIYCPVCGAAVQVICPRCNTRQCATNQMCIKCGFDFKNGLDSAKRTESAIRTKLAVGLVSEAAELTAGLARDFPSYPPLEELKRLTDEANRRYQQTLARLHDDYRVRCMYDLKRTAEQTRTEFPSLLNDPVLAAQYREAAEKVADAEKFCGEAAHKTGSEAMDLYIRAADRCPDHPEAVSKLKDFPPEAPADASIQTRDDTVVLRYAVPEDRRGMTFCIYRNKGTLPRVDRSSVPLAEIPGGVYQDRTLDPGADYYYAIYSRRWGILSRDCASCGPAIVFREVTNAVITPIEDGLHIEFAAPRGCSRVRIWRKEGAQAAGIGDEVEVQHDDSSRLNDRGLRGGIKYHYLFVAEYDVNGRTERSLGVEYVGETVCYPDPVMDMKIGWNKNDGSYTARWSSTEKVELYASPKRVKLYGLTVAMDDLQSWMKKIEPLETYRDGCRFELPDGAVCFIYPMIPVGRTAVRGRETMITNLRPFRDVEKRLNGNECNLSMTWPPDAESAVAVVGDRAEKADQPRSEKISISREAYDADRCLRISMGQAKKKTVALYAVYDIDGRKTMSPGVVLDLYSGACSKIRYTLNGEQGRTRKDGTVVLALDASEQLSLPPMVMVAVGEGLPLKMTDGAVIWESGGPVELSGGKAVFTFTVPRDRADVHRMRLFFPNQEDYNLYRFIHPLYAEED